MIVPGDMLIVNGCTEGAMVIPPTYVMFVVAAGRVKHDPAVTSNCAACDAIG